MRARGVVVIFGAQKTHDACQRGRCQMTRATEPPSLSGISTLARWHQPCRRRLRPQPRPRVHAGVPKCPTPGAFNAASRDRRMCSRDPSDTTSKGGRKRYPGSLAPISPMWRRTQLRVATIMRLRGADAFESFVSNSTSAVSFSGRCSHCSPVSGESTNRHCRTSPSPRVGSP